MPKITSPRIILPLLGAAAIYTGFRPIKDALTFNVTGSPSLSGWALLVAGLTLLLRAGFAEFGTYILFVWHCFLNPLGKGLDQKERLDKFYQGQAEVYDKTRQGLLRGRNTMLNLSAAHLRILRAANPNKRLVWVDIGGGTGWNIEAMDAHFPISKFDAVYVLDLCQPMLELARKRFERKGWKNVFVLCQDASSFHLPEWEPGFDPKGSVSFITLSYSLSMIPSYYTLLDRIDYVLAPEDGLLGVVDFYASGKEPSLHEKAIGGVSKQCGWISRWFWQIWFDFDDVNLSPGRRDYLEYRFGTIKSYNGRNRFILPFIVRIPYYVWLGCSRSRDVSRFLHAFEVEGGNMVGNLSPLSLPASSPTSSVPELELGESAIGSYFGPPSPTRAATVIDITPPLSSFHYQLKHPWRLPYYESPRHKEFRTFIYSFTWEDPEEDMRHLNLSKDDTVFCITSAGDNVLHYLIEAAPHRIHSVDMNPCQGHLAELKLAAIKALTHEEFFDLFGLGKIKNFRSLLDSRLSPFLSSHAYQFWRLNSDAFKSSFYRRGYSGWALRLAKFAFWMGGASGAVERLCKAETIEEQQKIWNESIRPIVLKPSLIKFVAENPVFLWNALGVPRTQQRCFLNDGSAYEFVRDTLDPVPSHSLLKDGAYHYLLCLQGYYTPESCPNYLTPRGFEKLKANDGKVLDAVRLHTAAVIDVLKGLAPSSITKAVIMDHMDWFMPGSTEHEDEVRQLCRALAPGGMVLWRSAARVPWYNEVFARNGFIVSPLGVRTGNRKAIDRVNMYASCWKAVKV